MNYPDIFSEEVVDNLSQRINRLTPQTQPLWGKMNVAQMLAHVNVSYEMAFENKHKRPGAFLRWILKTFVKETVVGDKPYKRNSPTAPAFKVAALQDFQQQQKRLLDYLRHCVRVGKASFDGKPSLSFGKMSVKEWNTMFYKHLDHHLSQFGV